MESFYNGVCQLTDLPVSNRVIVEWGINRFSCGRNPTAEVSPRGDTVVDLVTSTLYEVIDQTRLHPISAVAGASTPPYGSGIIYSTDGTAVTYMTGKMGDTPTTTLACYRIVEGHGNLLCAPVDLSDAIEVIATTLRVAGYRVVDFGKSLAFSPGGSLLYIGANLVPLSHYSVQGDAGKEVRVATGCVMVINISNGEIRFQALILPNIEDREGYSNLDFGAAVRATADHEQVMIYSGRYVLSLKGGNLITLYTADSKPEEGAIVVTASVVNRVFY